MTLPAAMPISPMLMTVLLVALVFFVVVPGPNRRLRIVTACAVFLVAGALCFHGRSGPRRVSVPPPPAPPSTGIVISGLPGLEQLDLDVSVPEAPHVQFKDGCLVVDAKPPVAPEAASQPAEGTAANEEAAPHATLRSEAAATLADYFDGLVHGTAPRSSRLRELRASLSDLTAGQRRQIADEAFRLRGTALRPDDHDGSVAQARLKPDEIIQLIKTRLPKTRNPPEGSGVAGALAAVGVVLAASLVLKRVTARAGARRP
jgi:hypothetical protein